MSECDHDFSIEENNQYNKCSKCGTWIEYKDIPLYETKRELKEKERQVSKLQDAYDFNLELLSEKERQLAEVREEIQDLKNIGNMFKCFVPVNIADLYNEQLKEKG